MDSISSIRKFENFHILLWLVKDLCWVTLSKPAAILMILPTLSLAFFITWKNRKFRSELLHNIAICFWICANSIWMIGEFYFHDGTRDWSVVFFVLGLLSMLYYYFMELFSGSKKNQSTGE
jgi:CHASE2 domain-containing sensor protein